MSLSRVVTNQPVNIRQLQQCLRVFVVKKMSAKGKCTSSQKYIVSSIVSNDSIIEARLLHGPTNKVSPDPVLKTTTMKKLLLIICLSVVSGFAMAQWNWQNPLPQGNALNSVFFPDANIGYAVGNYGTIVKTTNGGTDWDIESSGTTYNLTSVFFSDANTGYAVGNNGIILKTNDGGSSWYPLSSGTVYGLTSVYFINASTGFVAGGNFMSGFILKTTDGGGSWSLCQAGTFYNLNAVSFVKESVGYAVGDYGTFLKTTDGGTTWSVSLAGTAQQGLFSVHFTDINTGFVVGSSGTILKTTNGGTTWTVLKDSTCSNMGCIQLYWDDDMVLSTNELKPHILNASGHSNGWIRSRYIWWWNVPVKGDAASYPPDSIIVRFTFHSDANPSTKDGWMIDNILVGWRDEGSGVESLDQQGLLKIVPNPLTSRSKVISTLPGKPFDFSVYDLYGRMVYHGKSNPNVPVILNRENFNPGICLWKSVSTGGKNQSGKLVVY